jgi:AGCS family alanine or glycine:cation symporter
MGSTPHAHAMANVKKPHDQGVVAMIGVFIDTFVVLTMTALVLISCIFVGDGPLAGATGATYADMIANVGITKTNVMQMAYGSVVGSSFGNIFIAICLFFFAFSTIISWNFFGKLNAQYLTGNKKWGLIVYAVISIAFIFAGSILSNDLVWELTDFFNYLMVLPNVIALIALGAIVAKNSKK